MGPPPNNCVHVISRSLFVMPLRLFHSGLKVEFAIDRFPSRVERARHLLAASGYDSAAEFARSLRLPAGGWHCRTIEGAGDENQDILYGNGDHLLWPLGEEVTSETRALTAAVILGMCAPGFFSPDRPVIWSEARLARGVALVKPRSYYAP